VLQSTVEDRTFDGDGVMRSVTITDPAGTVKSWSMTWDPTRANGEVLSWQSGGQRTSFLYGNERAASMNATGLQSFEYNPLGNIVAGRAGTVESTGYAPYGKGETLNATVEPRFGYRGEIQIGNRVHLRARDLNTTTARFDRKDPLAGIPGETVETNQYHYANNDPIGQTDPSGLQPTDGTFALPQPKCTNGICIAGYSVTAGDELVWQTPTDYSVGIDTSSPSNPCANKTIPAGSHGVPYGGDCKVVFDGFTLVQNENGKIGQIPSKYCGTSSKCDITYGDVTSQLIGDLSGFWSRNSSKFAIGSAVLGFGICVVATAGACAVVAGGAVGISGAGNLVMYLGGDKSGWQSLGATALDLPGLFAPGVAQATENFVKNNLEILAERLANSGVFKRALLRLGYEAKKVVVAKILPTIGQGITATRTVACSLSGARNYACQ
jgi:RHS repeat-associated protein